MGVKDKLSRLRDTKKTPWSDLTGRLAKGARAAEDKRRTDEAAMIRAQLDWTQLAHTEPSTTTAAKESALRPIITEWIALADGQTSVTPLDNASLTIALKHLAAHATWLPKFKPPENRLRSKLQAKGTSSNTEAPKK